jgi:hypothetical protein
MDVRGSTEDYDFLIPTCLSYCLNQPSWYLLHIFEVVDTIESM